MKKNLIAVLFDCLPHFRENEYSQCILEIAVNMWIGYGASIIGLSKLHILGVYLQLKS